MHLKPYATYYPPMKASRDDMMLLALVLYAAYTHVSPFDKCLTWGTMTNEASIFD
jgi:hypothetical protein